jgi:hypothetical protein
MEYWDSAPTWLGLLVFLFAFVWVILWFFLPFIVYAMNSHIKELNQEAKETNDLLRALILSSAR